MDPWTLMFVIAAFVGFAISTCEIAAMALNYRRLTATVADIEHRAMTGLINGIKDPETKKAFMSELKPMMKDAIDQDMIEAWAGTAVMTLTDPNKPYLSTVGANIQTAVMSKLFNGPKGQNQKEIMKAVGPFYNPFKIENALVGATIPVHPGAMKYYKEVGIAK